LRRQVPLKGSEFDAQPIPGQTDGAFRSPEANTAKG
jgi:hypothetical protein